MFQGRYQITCIWEDWEIIHVHRTVKSVFDTFKNAHFKDQSKQNDFL